MNRGITALLLALFGLAIFVPTVALAQAETASASASGHEKILARLDGIEKKEDDILRQLDEIKAELNIVKVRATLKA